MGCCGGYWLVGERGTVVIGVKGGGYFCGGLYSFDGDFVVECFGYCHHIGLDVGVVEVELGFGLF